MELPGRWAVLVRVLASPALRRVLVGYFAFHVAEFSTWVGILLYAYDRTGPASVGVVALIQLVPAALVAAPAAALGDRYPRERVLAAGYLAQAVAMAMTMAAMLVEAPIPIVYGLAALAATSLTVTRPTQSALLPALARTPDELTAANGAAGVVEGLGILVGPLVAAVILVDGSVATVFGVAAAALILATLVTLGLRPSGGLAVLAAGPDETTGDGPGSARTEAARDDRAFLAGLRAIAGDRDARLLVGLLTARTLVIGCADVLFVLIALDLLGTGDPGAAVLNAALGLGTMLGGATTFALIGREGLAMIAAAAAILWGGALLAAGASGSALLAPLLIVVGGAGLAVVDVVGRTLLQRSTRDDVLARVFGIQESLAMAALAVGSILVAALVAAVGLVPAIGAVALILPGFVALGWGGIRALDRRAVVPIRAIALLRETGLFRPLPAPQLEAVARHGRWLTYPSGTVVIREGDVGDRYYVLASGAVTVEQDGRRLREIVEPGAGFGEIALLRDVPRTATVTTTTEVALLAIDRAPFLAAVTGHPDAFAAAESTAARLADRPATRR